MIAFNRLRGSLRLPTAHQNFEAKFGEHFGEIFGNFVSNFDPSTFSKVLPYKWEAYCRTNGRRTALQMGAVLLGFPFSPRLRSHEGPAIQMGAVLPYKLEVYCHMSSRRVGVPKGPFRTKNSTESKFTTAKKERYGNSKTLRRVLRSACFSTKKRKEGGSKILRIQAPYYF